MSIDEGDDNKVAEELYDADTRKKEATDFKDKGNTYVKAKDYESALKMYTRAIELCYDDPIFYSNRSQCYLSLEKYQDCINDASKAIELDPKATKAYYRRMTAYEKIGEDYKALHSCRQWLDLAPEDTSAKNSYDRIHNRIVEGEKKKDKEKIRWSRLGPNSEIINFVARPPHLRSKKPMKKVSLDLRKAISPIPESIIDRIFDNNTGEASPEVNSKLFKSNFLIAPKAEKVIADDEPKAEIKIIDNKNKVNETNEMLKASEVKREELPKLEHIEATKSHLITIPLSGPQFFASWKELSDVQRLLYLKNIVESNVPIGKLLGAQMDSEMLSEIIHIVHKFFLPYNIPFIGLLDSLRMNTEMSMLIMFLESDDKKSKYIFLISRLIIVIIFDIFPELSELLSASSRGVGDNATNNLVQEIKSFFQI
jgi:RNA polymerase II-associated protein 3